MQLKQIIACKRVHLEACFKRVIDVAVLAKEMTILRNVLTHEDRRHSRATQRELLELRLLPHMNVARVLVDLCFMDEMGISDEKQIELLKRNTRYPYRYIG